MSVGGRGGGRVRWCVMLSDGGAERNGEFWREFEIEKREMRMFWMAVFKISL